MKAFSQIPGSVGVPTIEAVAEDFAAWLGLSVSPKQARFAGRLARRFLWQAGGVGGVNQRSAEEWLAGLRLRGASTKTLWNHLSALSRLCDFMASRGLISANPCRDIRLPRLEKPPPKFLSEAETAQALDLARQHGFWPEVALDLATGLRLGELRRLQWHEVDLANRVLIVRKSKSGRFRAVPLSPLAVEALSAQREISRSLDWVFPARQTYRGGWKFRNGPRSLKVWSGLLKPLQEVIPSFRRLPPGTTGRAWHMLRHTFASRLAQRGVSIYKIAAWLGHSTIQTTQVYAHLSEGYDPDIEMVM